MSILNTTASKFVTQSDEISGQVKLLTGIASDYQAIKGATSPAIQNAFAGAEQKGNKLVSALNDIASALSGTGASINTSTEQGASSVSRAATAVNTNF